LRTLHAEQAGLRQRLREHPAQVARTRAAVERLCGRMDHWPVDSSGWSMLGPALKRIYKRGRRPLPTARPRPTDRSLHEWRKRVKYLRYALEILAPLRTRRLARLARQAEELTDRLGEAHDLAMLAQRARSLAKRDHIDLQPLLSTIDRRWARLTLDALRRGEQLYQARPADWERMLPRHWRRWQ
jgi:CHAD domain-containing protein